MRSWGISIVRNRNANRKLQVEVSGGTTPTLCLSQVRSRHRTIEGWQGWQGTRKDVVIAGSTKRHIHFLLDGCVCPSAG